MEEVQKYDCLYNKYSIRNKSRHGIYYDELLDQDTETFEIVRLMRKKNFKSNF